MSRLRLLAAVALMGLLLLFLPPALRADDQETASQSAGAEAREDEPGEAVAEAPPIDPLQEKAKEIRDELATLVERFEGLEAELTGAEGEDKILLARQIAEAKLDYLSLVAKLVENQAAQDEAGLDSGDQRAWIENELPDLSEAIVEHIEVSESALRALRKARVSADPQELDAIEDKIEAEIEWLESLFEGYLENLDGLKRMGVHHSPVLADLHARLATRADRLAGRIQLTSEKLDRLSERSAEAPDDASIQDEIRLVTRRKEMVVAAMTTTVDMMDHVGLDSSAYRRLLIRTTGEVTTDVFKGKVAIGLLQEWLEAFREWIREVGPATVVKAFLFLLILVTFRLLAIITRRLVQRSLSAAKGRTSQLLSNMALALAGRGVMILGLLVALSQVGVELGPLLAGLGIAGFIVGFALQDSLANFAAGIMILGYRPFDVDDVIEAGGVFGTVSTMNLVSTTILTFDNQTLIVPNAKIWGDVIKNVTNQKVRRVDLEVHVRHEEDVDRVLEILRGVLARNPHVLEDPPPNVQLHKLLENTLKFVVRPWTRTEDYWDTYWKLTREIKRALDEAGITLPRPQRDVHLVDRTTAEPIARG